MNKKKEKGKSEKSMNWEESLNKIGRNGAACRKKTQDVGSLSKEIIKKDLRRKNKRKRA